MYVYIYIYIYTYTYYRRVGGGHGDLHELEEELLVRPIFKVSKFR